MAKNIKKKFKPKEGKDIAKEELKRLEDLPLVGGLFKGLEKFIDLVEKVEEAGGEIKKRGEIKGLGGETKGIYGFSIRTGIGEKPKIQTFGNIRQVKEKRKPEFKITETREPIVDVFDEKEHILIIVELPGVAEESIKLDLHPVKSAKGGAAKPQFNRVKGDILILQAGDDVGLRRKYVKEILLPAKIDFEQRETHFKNGILEMKLKKI